MTELDDALAAARANNNQANYFYDAFLNAELVFPVQAEGSQRPAWRELAADEKFHPLFVPSETLKVLPVFDSLERLQSWAAPRQLDYIRLRSHVLLRFLGGEVGIVLNAGTEWAHSFKPETLVKLREAMKPVKPV